MAARILVFAGSSRTASFNKQLAKLGVEALRGVGGEARMIDLRDYPMPIYDGDLEAAHGVPENALALKRLFKEHDGFLVASPENNGSVSALLKNTIDWVSRAIPGEAGNVPFRGKTAALMSAATGAPGGARGLPHLRQILASLGVLVLPDQLGVARAATAFDEAGALKDPAHRQGLLIVAAKLADVTARLAVP